MLLAQRLASLAKKIREQVLNEYNSKNPAGTLHRWFEIFKDHLFPSITPGEFADMYAQTITYCLFAARIVNGNNFSASNITALIPPTSHLLKNMFKDLFPLDKRAGSTIDIESLGVLALVQLLQEHDFETTLQDIIAQCKGEDPIVFFYEIFLSEYDPQQRAKHGIYSTPGPAVQFIVRGTDYFLQHEFHHPGGLADASLAKSPGIPGPAHEIEVLDPATGTGTFLAHVIGTIFKTFKNANSALPAPRFKQVWNEYVAQHLLPRLHGFELLLSPLAIAHVTTCLALKETGYNFIADRPIGIHLANALEGVNGTGVASASLADWVAEEKELADRVKNEIPVSVILGNPPYRGSSTNDSEWMRFMLRGSGTSPELAANYFEVDGAPLDEKNPKWLNDDYVKFFRFAQWRIDKTGAGIVAFITNHGYLDNPTFRGMRQSLLASFDTIYILNLHGNTKKEETCPDGSKDENIFAIEQGVAIGFFLKKPAATERHVYYADLYGLASHKLEKLAAWDIPGIPWIEIHPRDTKPFYFFYPVNAPGSALARDWSIKDAMPVNSTVIVTGNDAMAIHFSPDDVWRVVQDLHGLAPDKLQERYGSACNPAKAWLRGAIGDIKERCLSKDAIKPILYRPFDTRYTYYTGRSAGFHGRPRNDVMSHMLLPNTAIITRRRMRVNRPKNYFSIASTIVADGAIRSDNHGTESVFPIYVYPGSETALKTAKLFEKLKTWEIGDRGRVPNLDPGFVAAIASAVGLRFIPDGHGDLNTTFGPDDVLQYMFAIFHSNRYRTRYADLLEADFPRVPLTTSKALFVNLVQLGSDAASSYAMRGNAIDVSSIQFMGTGDNVIRTVKIDGPLLRINKQQYFQGIPAAVLSFEIGAYSACTRWLEERKGRKLVASDVDEFKRIAAHVQCIIATMERIDATIQNLGGLLV
nr:type ISP restriction/modification enzyme [Candidatus Sigynarchaeota archaeon]